MLKEIADLKVSYEVAGDGYPLVLLHSGSTDLLTWEDMIPHLAKRFRVYRVDLRGYGSTVRPPQPRLSFDVWTEDLVRFLDSFGIERAALAGWSLGGDIIINFAERYPERVSQLVLIGVMSPLSHAPSAGWQARARLALNGASMAQIVEQTFESTKRTLSTHTQKNRPDALERVRQTLLRNHPMTYVELVESLDGLPALAPKLGAITCPTLVLVGDEDVGTSVESAEGVNKAIPRSYMKIIPNCGHCYPYEQAELTSGAMIDFLTAFGSPGGGRLTKAS